MEQKNAKSLDKVYMTAKEVRELFHVHQRTVCRWREAGKIHGIKLGREYVYPASEIADLMNDTEAAELREIMRARAQGVRGLKRKSQQ